MNKKSLIISLFCFLAFSKAYSQVKFELVVTPKQDTVFYALKYHGPKKFNGNSITCNWFTMREYVYFFSAYWNGGLNYRRYPGPFPGNKYTFNHKVSAGYNFDVDLDSGQVEIFAFCENFDNIPDTVLCANLDVYGSFDDSTVRYSVYPPSEKDCPFERVYIQAGLSISGIQLGSFANSTIHQTKNCKQGLVGVVFDQYTVQPTTMGSFIPTCADGRKWKSFGYPKNEQVYFDFDWSSDSGQQYFSDFVDAMSDGDHLFLATSNRTIMGKISAKLKSALFKLGMNEAQYASYNSEYQLMICYGRKGLKSGKMIFYSFDLPAYMQREVFILPKQPLDTVYSFAPCYEVLTKKIMERQPKPSGVDLLESFRFSVFPNPTQQNWTVFSKKQQHLSLYNAQMQLIQSFQVDANSQTFIDASNLKVGVYFLRGNNFTSKLMKSSN